MFHKESTEFCITSIVTSPDRHGISFHPIVYINVNKIFKLLLHIIMSNKYKMKQLISCFTKKVQNSASHQLSQVLIGMAYHFTPLCI